MTIKRDVFFPLIRASVFGGSMTQKQVDGINFILDVWETGKYGTDPRWLAYELATTWWETGRTMQPIEEWGHGAGQPYGVRDPRTGQVYDGRGDVQLTWYDNYLKMGNILGIDLVNHPELALEPEIAAAIMFLGMRDGDFTGLGLGHYFNATTDDPMNARRIVNAMDHAEDIAQAHGKFLAALSA